MRDNKPPLFLYQNPVALQTSLPKPSLFFDPRYLNNTLPVVRWLHKDLGGQCVFASEVDVDCQASPQWCVEKFGWLFGVVLCFVSSAFVGRINSFITWSLPKSCKDTRRATCMGYEWPTEKSVGSWWIFYDFVLLFVLWKSLDFEDVKFWDAGHVNTVFFVSWPATRSEQNMGRQDCLLFFSRELVMLGFLSCKTSGRYKLKVLTCYTPSTPLKTIYVL